MNHLTAEIDWFDGQPLRKSEHLQLCVCMTESLINQQQEPERMRAFLLVSVFFDQLVQNRFSSCYQSFEAIFNIPKLLAHGGREEAKPDWLLDQRHGFDEHVKWELIETFAAGAMEEVLHWVQAHCEISAIDFKRIVAEEIVHTFSPDHQERLLSAFHLELADYSGESGPETQAGIR